jgi:hypothetical protein
VLPAGLGDVSPADAETLAETDAAAGALGVALGSTAPGASGMSSPPSPRSRNSLVAMFQFFAR